MQHSAMRFPLHRRFLLWPAVLLPSVLCLGCGGVDADGDVWTIWYGGDEDGGDWGYMGGTGKFEGIKGGGTFSAESQWSDGRGINSWEGTYTLR